MTVSVPAEFAERLIESADETYIEDLWERSS